MTKQEALAQIDRLIAVLNKHRQDIQKIPDATPGQQVDVKQKAMLKEASHALGAAGTVCTLCNGSGRLP